MVEKISVVIPPTKLPFLELNVTKSKEDLEQLPTTGEVAIGEITMQLRLGLTRILIRDPKPPQPPRSEFIVKISQKEYEQFLKTGELTLSVPTSLQLQLEK